MNQPYHYIGLDIHKRTVSFCEKRADGKKIASGTFRTDVASVTQWAMERSTPWIGGMEATIFTGYLYDTLSPFAVELLVGHPLSIKAISSAKHKNDSIDAETLSNLLRADLFPESYMASSQVRALRRALRFRNFLVRMAVNMKNRTTGILMETGIPYDAKRIHGKRYFREFLGNLDEVPEFVGTMLQTNRGLLELFEQAQADLLNALATHDDLCERVMRLSSIRSVGEVTALTWALEIDDPSRFSNIKKAQSYCGLCSGQNESGGVSKRAPLSRQRNANLQHCLIEAAKLAPQWNEQLRAVRTKSLEQDKNRNRATCAVARKLVAYLMAVDKSGKDFEILTPTR